MSNRAWMPLHIADYLADTGHLTALEHGAYLLMIMHYWQNGSLPENERLIARIAKLDAAQWAESRDILAMLFGPNWTHKRIDAEMEKADAIIEKRRAAADSRYQRSKPDASAVHMQCKSSDTGALPRTNNLSEKEEPTGSSKKRGERLPDDFIPSADDAVAIGLSTPDVAREAAKFRDYWRAQPGQRGVKLDWPATWRNWCRKALETRPRGTSPPSKPNAFTAYEEIARMKGWTDEPGSLPVDHEDAQRLPAVGGERHGAVVDLRRGADFRAGSGNR